MSKIEQKVHGSSLLWHHRDYYLQQTEVSRSLGNYRQAYESCMKSIDFNNRLGGDRNTKNNAYLLLEMQADTCLSLGERERCVNILE